MRWASYVKGTRTPVQAIVESYRLGMSASEILTQLPHITEAQLHDALSYFYDHKEEILEGIQSDHELIQKHEVEQEQKEMEDETSK